MPAQKRSHDSTPSPPPQPQQPEENDAVPEQLDQNDHEEPPEEEADSDGSSTDTSSDGEKDEFVVVKLSDVRKEVQCPICLGIIRKTRTVMECLHRFCRECIDKSMRLGNNECPACRTHCASRRSLRDDPTYDALITALFPDIDKYEEEEFAFHEDEKARNKQIQALIAETLRRQSEALGKKKTARATASAFLRRSHGNYRHVRGRRNSRTPEHAGSEEDDDVDGNDGGKDSSSADEHSPEVKPKRYKRWGGARFGLSSMAANDDGLRDGNDTDTKRESLGAAAGLVGTSDILAWGKGGIRSHSRHGGLNGSSGKFARNSRLSALMDRLRCSNRDNNELDISLKLVSLQEDKIPTLERPYLCCRPTFSIRQLCEYVALEASVEADQIQIWEMKSLEKETESHILQGCETQSATPISDLSKYEACLLEEHQTLGELHTAYSSRQQNLLLAYGLK